MGVISHALCFGLIVLGFVRCKVFPVVKCKFEDSACMKVQFQTAMPTFMGGIPELGIEVLDILNMDDFKFELAGLQFTLTEGKLEGLKTSVIDDLKWDTKKKQVNVQFHLNGTIKGHYTAAGRILILPITGDGRLTLKLKFTENLSVKLDIRYEIVEGADDKEHMKSTKLKTDFDVKGNVHFHFTDLFHGNKELSDVTLRFLNENWKIVTEEFGQPLIESVANKLHRNIKRFLEKVPITDIGV